MKRTFLLLLSLLILLGASDKSPQQAYIEKYSDLAVSEMLRTGVPASITIAQGLLESSAGKSLLAVEGNNHFGIKCHNNWNGKTIHKDDDAKGECFRAYRKPEQSFRDHSDFLRYRDRYKFLFSYEITDYKSWCYGLQKAGYATDPSYASKLIKIIEDYSLWRYDTPRLEDRKDTAVSIPESPEVLEQAVPRDIDSFDERFSFPLNRPVYEKNGVPFVISSEGESYSSIAASYGLFRSEILRFNDIPQGGELLPGTVVYLQHKKSRAAKGLDKYIVEGQEESLRDICQRFAVKLSSIRSLNGFTDDYKPSEGDVILLRRQKKN